jgi:hypothetical protein
MIVTGLTMFKQQSCNSGKVFLQAEAVLHHLLKLRYTPACAEDQGDTMKYCV